VQLTLAGPAAGDKRKACLEEAHNWGLNIGPSQVAATLFLSDQGNRVDLPIGPRPLGKWSAKAVCRVALAYAVGLDRMVRVARVEPQGCQEVGPVQGDDQGYAFFVVQIGSYEAALAALQFSARMRGANYVVMDLARQVGLNFSINGRAFRCEAPPPPPPEGGGQPMVPPPTAPPPGAPPNAY
jgi:hypothetical protein